LTIANSSAPAPGEARLGPRFRYQLLVATFTRLVMNTAQRMAYPFLPEFSRGLGVPLEALTLSLSIRGGLGMTAPVFGVLPDRLGRRHAMLIGVLVFAAALLTLALFPSYLTFTLAVVLVVLAKFTFDPALQAFLADRTPYSRRGLVIGLSELGWSGAALVGIPLAGFLIARAGWRAPYLPIAGLGLAAGLLLWWILPSDRPGAVRDPSAFAPRWRVIGRPMVLAALSVSLLASMANEFLNVVFGAWLEGSFGLAVAGLGLSATVVGVAELAGEGLVMTLADRLGKRRVIAFGLAASAAAYLALPYLASRLELALAGLFLVFITFEFTIVATIPLVTELAPEARGTVISTSSAFHAAGRMLGALAGPYLFRLGFQWTGVTACLLNVAALGLVLWLVRERQGGSSVL
jgi:predicted MFS family arabinose efflux permease